MHGTRRATDSRLQAALQLVSKGSFNAILSTTASASTCFCVLVLGRLQKLGIGNFHAAELRFPFTNARFADPALADVGDHLSRETPF
jgi:hypothetical protein